MGRSLLSPRGTSKATISGFRLRKPDVRACRGGQRAACRGLVEVADF